MRPEDKLLFLCARQDFSDAHLKALIDLGGVETIDWEELFFTARQHGVAPLIWANLEKAIPLGLSVAPDVIHKFQLACYHNVVAKGKRAKNLVEALALLGAHSIEVMALKSVALDFLVYEQVWYTTAADTDLVLRPRQREVSPQALAEISRFFAGLGIEYEFYDHHDMTMNGLLPVDFERIWNDARSVCFQGHSLFLMSAEDMLLSLCINSSRKRFFRIRSLVDIAETVSRCRELDWATLIDKARIYQCNHIAYTALVVTQATLGCDLPEAVLDRLGIGRLKVATVRHLVPFLIEHLPLATLSFYTGWDLFGRKVGWSLVLPYATERWRRIGGRIQAAYQAWRRQSP
jgi:hypothetical protein